MSKTRLTAEALWGIPRVGDPAVSPDGRVCARPVATHSLEANEAPTRLWWVPAAPDAGGHGSLRHGEADAPPSEVPRPLTAPDVSASRPAISPDGRWLLFVRKPGGAP